jgi:transcription antitermination factor NusG
VTGYGGALCTSEMTTRPALMNMDDRMWFALQTWPRYEKRVLAELNNKAVDAFLPLQTLVHQWSDRRRLVQVPLFPNYVFVRISNRLDSRIPVLRTSGVIQFVGLRGVGTPIADSEIESIRTVIQRGMFFQSHLFLEVGQRVRIRGGSLDGVEGILVGKNEDLSLIISIHIIQRSIAVRVSGYEVEAA